MSRPTFLIYLFSKNKLPLYVDEYGNVVEGTENYLKLDNTSAALTESPDGWKALLLKYARNIKYWGVFRTFGTTLTFYKDAAKILRYLFWRDQIEAVCYIGVLRLDVYNLPYTYRPYFISELNFAKYNESGNGVKIEALDGGITKYLKAFENTVYEIDIENDPEHVNILWDGMELFNTATFAVGNGLLGFNDSGYEFGNHLVDLGVVQKEVEDIGGVFDVPRTKVGNQNDLILATKKPFFTATVSGVVKVEWNFDLTVSFTPPPAMYPGLQLNVVLRFIDPVTKIADPAQQVTLLQVNRDFIVNTHHIQGNAQVTVTPGLEAYLYTFVNVQGEAGDVQTGFTYSGTEPYIKLSYTLLYPQSVVKGLYAYRLFQKLADKMSSGLFPVVSSAMLEAAKDIVITSGNAIRGNHNATIKTSMAQFFKAMGFFSVGLGVEDEKLVIEPISYFFKKTVAITLPQVSDATIDPAIDIDFNTIKAGYGKQEYQGINGVYEFNQGQQYTTPITKVVTELDLQSPYRADPFGLELLRINFGKRTTTDNASDNDTCIINVEPTHISYTTTISFTQFYNGFTTETKVQLAIGQRILVDFGSGLQIEYGITNTFEQNGVRVVTVDTPVNGDTTNQPVRIDILGDGFVKLRRPLFDAITGVLSVSTVFNVLLSPKTGLLNNAAYLRSVLDLQDSKSIKFASADRNKDLSYTYNGNTVSEKDDLTIGNLAPRLFKPYYITFKTTVPVNLPELIASNPYGLVSFVWNDRTWTGYLMDGSIQGGDNETQTWKLLSSATNDLSKFNANE